MLVDAIVKETKEVKVKKEIRLPYCGKEGLSYFRINPDESILKLFLCGDEWGQIEIIEKKASIYPSTLARIVNDGIPCHEYELVEFAEKIHAMVERRIESKLQAV